MQLDGEKGWEATRIAVVVPVVVLHVRRHQLSRSRERIYPLIGSIGQIVIVSKIDNGGSKRTRARQ